METKELYDLELSKNVENNFNIPYHVFRVSLMSFLDIDSITVDQLYIIYKYSKNKKCIIKSNILKEKAIKLKRFFSTVNINISIKSHIKN